jgi:hypothetical protein
MRALAFASLTVFFAAAFGCSAVGSTFTTGTGAGATGGAGTGGAGTGTGGMVNLTTSVGTGTGGGVGQDCTVAATLVYVLTTAGDIYSFQPAMKQFTYLGTPACTGTNTTLQANSMAIDRNVVAWINYVSNDGTMGAIYRYDLTTNACVGSPITLPSGWERIGMGFSADTDGGTSETLFVTATNGVNGLGTIDMTNDTVVPAPGPFSGDANLDGQDAELTGTGDGRLYGFFTTNPVRVAQIDKTSAMILSDAQITGVPMPGAWAFTFWGGSFYLYTSPGAASTTVTRYDPTSGAITLDYVAPIDLNFTIDGAGVSTCAPITPPM